MRKTTKTLGGLCRKLGGDVLDEGSHLSSSIMVEEYERNTGTWSLDAKTSLDSEVINSVPDSIFSIGLQNFDASTTGRRDPSLEDLTYKQQIQNITRI